MSRKKLSLIDLQEMKAKGIPVAWITSYDFPTAQFAEAAGADMILVGDSLGMCVYGYVSTIPVTMDQCIIHCKAVRRGAPSTFIIGDMPFLSYQVGVSEAILNAGRFHKEANVEAVKLEGGYRVCKQIEAIADAGMLVMGHIGLTPQSSGQLGGFKAQGLTADSAKVVLEDAKAVQSAGAFALLVEAVPPEVCRIMRDKLNIPVYSIGAGMHADGQLMICSDVLGQFQAFTPKFVKKYEDIAERCTKAFQKYFEEVRERSFPTEEHTYKMREGEFDKLKSMLKG
jgi:3-methyl-2-oxobutanoate hydroxymethyltransferase